MKLKELNQADFKMKIIKDLGMKPSRGSSNRNIRFAIFECCECSIQFETIVSRAKTKQQTKCKSCSQKTHGLSKSNLYQRYQNMLTRCYNPNSDHYASYGAIGVTVCDEWLTSFESFSKWALENGYKKHLELDKDIGSKKLGIYPPIYSPETCQFISSKENSKHRKVLADTNKTGYKGVTKHKNKFKATINVEGIFIHLGLWRTALEAAKAYDYYVISNNLERDHNKTLQKNEKVNYDKSHEKNTSGYKGVYKKAGKFATYCYIGKGIKKHLGTFNSAQEAANFRHDYIVSNNLININKL